MFKKLKIKNEIKALQKLIEETEKKRYRSQSELVAAILASESPNDNDVDYFNRYTATIEETRNKIHEKTKELEALEK